MAGRQSRTDIRALGRLTGHGFCNPARLAEATGIPRRTVYNAVEGLTALAVPDLRLVLGAMVRLGQEEDALALVRELLDLDALGWDLRPAPRPAPAASLADAGLQATCAAGEAVAVVSEALSDGRIDATEAQHVEEHASHARHRFDRLLSFLRCTSGQGSLPGLAR